MRSVPSLFANFGLACAMAFSLAPSAAFADVLQQNQADKASVQGVSLSLTPVKGMCQLTAKKGEATHTQPLNMQWPCAFHLDLSSEVRIKKSGVASYVIVESFKRQDEPSKDCQTSLKSVKIQKSKAEVSKNTAQVASCPPFQWDSYVFTELF